MLRKRYFVLLFFGALAVFVSAGCGGGNDTATTAGSIGKAEFIKQANGICEEGKERLHAGFEALINEKVHRSNTREEEEWVNKVIVPNIKREVREIRELGTPNGDENSVKDLLAAIEDGLNKLEEKPEEVLASSAETFSEAIKLATEYGLKTCAQTY